MQQNSKFEIWPLDHRYVPLNISPTEFGWILKDVDEQMPDPVESAFDDLANGDL